MDAGEISLYIYSVSETGFHAMVAPECLKFPSLYMVFLSNYQLKQPGKICYFLSICLCCWYSPAFPSL